MIGLGTIVNVLAIIAGGLDELISKRFLRERYQETILKVMEFAIIVMALSSTLSQMFVVNISVEAAVGNLVLVANVLPAIVIAVIFALF